ncbi:leucyl aminopeptidase (aminopeptidase T) [Desulfitobacterium dichloroeliminans LMG P-21439]|uniref:Leucyl aminopeptidase (Aminopeptidase T) n=1 Tax=Desulfitobacterium dichloroeliminans (strain LMG P-21439 / DCA1) TaxID=871963 RepID=L0F818_DESDL|nr:aminopeptidase [Desulfitobacterium dichloroeliminans]AGA69073.1 leucyl aminopeptidase (aminopeptidase T) [Desulfitobacterium dichloroeliminans LMG P-21439]
MKDPRIEKLADSIINYAVELKPGEKILIEVNGLEIPLAQALVRYAYEAGGIPFVSVNNHTLLRELLKGMTEEQARAWAKWDLARMKEMDAFVGLRATENANELADVAGEKMSIYQKEYLRTVTDQRVSHTKWVVMRYPNASMAQLANTSIEAFEDFYFKVCNLDYAKMSAAMEPLVELMERTDKVRITGPGTDLTFSIKGMKAIKCDGHLNIPDGEVYTAPLKSSVHGVISYNTAALYQGFTYENIVLEFKEGKVVKATANDTERIEKIFNTDEGARYIGEFAIGVNPYILHPMKDTLFDEKIDGSFHFTPGNCYDDCNNGNKSAIHWDLVCIQRPEYGGGEMYFDDVLVRKDGRFMVAELQGLNPENLK